MSDSEKKEKKSKKSKASEKPKKQKTDITKPKKPKKSRGEMYRTASSPVFDKQLKAFDKIIDLLGAVSEEIDADVERYNQMTDTKDKTVFVNWVMETKAKIWNMRDLFKYNKMFIEREKQQLLLLK